MAHKLHTDSTLEYLELWWHVQLESRPPCSLAAFQPRLPSPCSLQWPPNLPIKSGHPDLESNTMAKISSIYTMYYILYTVYYTILQTFWSLQKLASTWSTLGLSGGFVCSKALEDSQPFIVRTWHRIDSEVGLPPTQDASHKWRFFSGFPTKNWNNPGVLTVTESGG